jgi:hypothetical protein
VSIYLKSACSQAANAIVENVTANGFSIVLKLLNKPGWVPSIPNESRQMKRGASDNTVLNLWISASG